MARQLGKKLTVQPALGQPIEAVAGGKCKTAEVPAEIGHKSLMQEKMAGVAGIEPANGGTKNRCLTAWLHPSKGCAL